MDGDAANSERHADLAKRTADLEAVHASLDFIESELLVKDVLSKLDRTEFLREQMVAVRKRGSPPDEILAGAVAGCPHQPA